MNAPSRKRPSIGFVAFCLTYLLAAAFVAWGLSTPDLDRVWTLHHLLKIGEMKRLDRKDKEILSSSMSRHERLARDLLDGSDIGIISAHVDGWIETPCATLLRTQDSLHPFSIVLHIETPKDLLPFSIEVKGPAWKKNLEAKEHGALRVDLPEKAASPEIIEVILKGRGIESDPSALGVKIAFEQRGATP